MKTKKLWTKKYRFTLERELEKERIDYSVQQSVTALAIMFRDFWHNQYKEVT